MKRKGWLLSAFRCGLVAAGVLLPGCALESVIRRNVPVPLADGPARVVQVIEDLDERRRTFESVSASLHAVLEYKGRAYDMQGAYLGDKAGNLRLRLTYRDAVFVDIAFMDEQVDLYLPRKKARYRGTRADVLGGSNHALYLLAAAGSVQNLFYPHAWSPQAVERRFRTENGLSLVSVFERPGVSPRCAFRLALSPHASVTEWAEFFQHDENSVGSVRYDQYSASAILGQSGTTEHAVPAYPRRIKLVTASGETALCMAVQTISFNQDLAPAKFVLDSNSDVPILELSSMTAQGVSLWE